MFTDPNGFGELAFGRTVAGGPHQPNGCFISAAFTVLTDT